MSSNRIVGFITTRVLPIVALAGLSFGGGQALAMDARQGHVFGEGHPRTIAMQRFAAEVGKNTGGKITLKVYGNSQLGAEGQMLMAVQSGTLEFYLGSLAPISPRKKELQIFDFPFLFANDDEAKRILDGAMGKHLLDDMGDTGALGLVWSGGAFRHIANSRRPIKAFEDLKGLKIRVMQTPVAMDSFKAMGVNPTPMAYSEIYTALEIKAIDGFENPPVDMYTLKFYEVQKYLAISNHVYTPIALMVSKKWFSALPADQQKAVMKAAETARGVQRSEGLRLAGGVVGML